MTGAILTPGDKAALREIVVAAVVGALEALQGVSAAEKSAALEVVFPGLPDDVLIEAEVAVAEAAEQPFWNAMAEQYSQELETLRGLKRIGDRLDAMGTRMDKVQRSPGEVDDQIPF